MSMITERAAVESRFFDKWDSKTTPVKLDNVKGLVQGNTKVSDQNQLSEWCWLTISPGTAAQADMGRPRRVRYTGTIGVNLFVKEATGASRIKALVDAVISIFQFATLADGTRIRAGVTKAGVQLNGSDFYQVSVQFPYWRDEFPAEPDA